MEKESSVVSAEGRLCGTCNSEMEFNPVTGGYFCTVCGRIDKQTDSGFQEDSYVSSGKLVAGTEGTTDRKCIKCGGVMNYDPETKMLKCPFCGNIINLNLISLGYKAGENDFAKEKRRANRDWGFKTKTVVCASCGGRTVYDYLELSGKCLYCGSNQVTEVKTSDMIAPGGVCPFTVNSEDAKKSFTKWIRKRHFCPREAKLNSKPKDIRGVYLPFWTFDTDTTSEYTAVCTSNKSDGDVPQGRTMFGSGNVAVDIGLSVLEKAISDTDTVTGIHHQFFNDVLIPAAANHDDAILKQLEPYDTDKSIPYSPEFIAGFAAEVYSTGLDEAWETAQEECKKRLEESIRRRVGFEHYTNIVGKVKFDTQFEKITFKCLLLPVWISSFTYRGDIYQFMVNGCTGKTAGNFPLSKAKIAAAIIGALALCALAVYWFFLR